MYYSFSYFLRHAKLKWDPFDFHHHLLSTATGLNFHFVIVITHFSLSFLKQLTQTSQKDPKLLDYVTVLNKTNTSIHS